MNKLVENKVAKTPVIIQLEALECGAVCLAIILAYFGKWVLLEEIRYECGVSQSGSKASNILKVARNYGLNAKMYSIKPYKLKMDWKFPCIIYWNFVHFVVLNGFKGDNVYINDPACGNIVIKYNDFIKKYTGICFTFEPNENFVPSGNKPNVYKIVLSKIKNLKSTIIFISLISISLSLIKFVFPIFDKVFVDMVLTFNFSGYEFKFFVFFTLCIFGQVLITLIQNLSNFRVSAKMEVVGNLTFLWKILHLPLTFFSQRSAGDLMNRQNANATIANTLLFTLAPLFFEFLIMILYLIVMFRYSFILGFIGLSSSIINIFIVKYVSKIKFNMSRVALMDNSKLYTNILQAVSMIDTIKSNAIENSVFSVWAGNYAKYLYNKNKLLEIDEWYTVGLKILVIAFEQFIFVTGIYLCLIGEFSVGMILAFTGFYKSFINPSITIASTNEIIQETYTQIERIDDVMRYPEDKIFNEDIKSENISKLFGNISIKNLVFGYSRLEKPIINNFSLEIKQGESVAIVGSSGSGKSTISKLISGLYVPWEGEIYFDSKKINEISKDVIKNSLSIVDQDITLYADTIENNIKMWDDSIMDFEVILASKDANVHDDILKKPKGYGYKLLEDGINISGGERQRLEIARALAQDPTIVILDEATSALDSKTENSVVNSIKNRGITNIVIAHRLSTIRSCDRIIVLDKGRIIDEGTHDELIKRCSIYKELILTE